MDIFQVVIDIAPGVFSLLLILLADHRNQYALRKVDIANPLKTAILWRLKLSEGITALFLAFISSITIFVRHRVDILLIIFIVAWSAACLLLLFWFFRIQDYNPTGAVRIAPGLTKLLSNRLSTKFAVNWLVARQDIVTFIEILLVAMPLIVYFAYL